jgi:hypothetical protein
MKQRHPGRADDLDILDLAGTDTGGDEAGHRAAEDAAYKKIEVARTAAKAEARTEFLAGIADPAMRHAFTLDPEAQASVENMLEGSVFATSPADAENYGRAVAQVVLKVAGRVAGVVAAAKAGKASGASTKDKLAKRNEIIRAMWAQADPRKKDSVRARETEERLRRESKELLVRLGLSKEEVKLSARQILRIVKVVPAAIPGSSP